MSAPAVKPALPAPGAGAQAPTSTAASPLKNHSGSPNMSITLVNDKTPEKSKDPVPPTASPKSTPNGVEAAKSGSPLVNDKKGDEANHITSNTATTLPVNNVTQNTATPPKATPEKNQPTNTLPPVSANSTTPSKSSAPSPTSGPTTAAVSTPPPATGGVTSAAADKQVTPVKTNSTPVDDKEKQTQAATSPTTPKRGAEKTEKQEKDKEKVGTASRIKRKRDTAPPSTPTTEDTDSKGSKRTRVPVQPYQSPMPDIFPTKVKTPAKAPVEKEKEKEKDADKEKLVIFYKNEFLAVRNSEGSFYVCQAMQNVYKSSHKIKIRWLSQVEGEKSEDGTVYSPDFYDTTDFDCILTSLSLKRVEKSKFNLSNDETLRTENILKRALDVEKGVSEKPELTEEHPDGLDLSLFKDEAQLKKRKSQGKRAASGSPKRARRSETPVKKEDKPKPEKKKPVVTPKRTPVRKAASPRLTGKKSRTASVGKTPKKVKDEKPEKIEKQTAQTRAERASEREKAKEGAPASKTPAKRKAESPVPPVESKAPKTTARTAASAKKAAAEAKAAAQAAIAAQAATAAASPAGRKPPARGRRGAGNAETPEPEVAAPQSRATKRNARPSSPIEAEKKASPEVTKEENEAKSGEVADAPASASSVTPVSETTAATAPAAPTATASAAPAVAPADCAGAPSEQKVLTAPETTPSAASSESTAASESKSPSSDASPNRGAPKKSTTPSPPKKA